MFHLPKPVRLRLPLRWRAGDPAMLGRNPRLAESFVVVTSDRMTSTGVEMPTVRSTRDGRIMRVYSWQLHRPGAERRRRQGLTAVALLDLVTLVATLHSGQDTSVSIAVVGVLLASLLMAACAWPSAEHDLTYQAERERVEGK